jgi:TetR/AcrR family transcriptional repressor of nem operon
MRYDADHKAQTRARVLSEAVKAIRADGPERIGVAGVMARAGLTHGGFYAHFASKDDLVLAAIEQMFASARATFDQRTRDLPPAEALAAYVRFYLSRAHRDARDVGCPLPILSSDLPRMAEPVRERFAEGVARLTASIAERLAALGRPEAQALASSALSEMIGALSLARAIADPEQSDAVLLASRNAILKRLDLSAEPGVSA